MKVSDEGGYDPRECRLLHRGLDPRVSSPSFSEEGCQYSEVLGEGVSAECQQCQEQQREVPFLERRCQQRVSKGEVLGEGVSAVSAVSADWYFLPRRNMATLDEALPAPEEALPPPFRPFSG